MRAPLLVCLVAVPIASAVALSGCARVSRATRPPAASQDGGIAYAAPSLAVGGIRCENVAAKAGIRYRWPQQPRPLRNLEAYGEPSAGAGSGAAPEPGW